MIKLTAKRENFAVLFVKTGNATEAYRTAFEVKSKNARAHRVDASKLLHDPKVAARIEELREKLRKRHDLKLDDLMAELDENRDLALTEKQSSAATAATMGKAKLAGFLIDKVAVDVTLRGLAEKMRQRRQKGGESAEKGGAA